MIYDHLDQQLRYRNCHPGLALAFDYLTTFDPQTPDGRVDLDGDRVFALVQSYETSPASGRQFESHYNYVDLQYMVSGEEIIYHSPLGPLKESVPYNPEKDLIFYTGEAAQALIMTPGMFTVLFPQDGHMPCCSHRADAPAKKVVIKLRV